MNKEDLQQQATTLKKNILNIGKKVRRLRSSTASKFQKFRVVLWKIRGGNHRDQVRHPAKLKNKMIVWNNNLCRHSTMRYFMR